MERPELRIIASLSGFDRYPLPLSERIENADRFLPNTAATIHHGGNSAFYAPARDVIQLPPFEAFKDKESYYATALHELTHWTKHENRLDRDFGRQKFGDTGYAREEPRSCAPTSASRRRSGTTTPPILTIGSRC